ncbi:MAG: metallophosphoesterase [Planctomycetota bacterium]
MSPLVQFLFAVAAALGHSVLWVGVVNRVHSQGVKRWIVDGATLLSVILWATIPLAYAWLVFRAGSLAAIAEPSSTLPRAYAWFAIAVLAVATLTRIAFALHPERRGVTRQVESLPIEMPTGEPLLTPAAGFWAHLPGNQVVSPRLVTEELFVPRLPEELDGFRIAHLSDLHMSGRVAKRYFETIVDATLAAEPELIAVTGDLVEFQPQHAWLDDTLLRLAAPEGVWFVRGNHDEKHDHQTMIATLEAGGLVHVGGRAIDRAMRGRRVRVVGNEVPWYRRPGEPAVDDSADEAFVLCLAHGPDQFRWAERHGVDLMLAGHNHGGQVRLPVIGALVTPSIHGTRYNSGAFRRGRTVMHVTNGAGSLEPVRYNCPPEVVMLVLRRPA